MITNSGNGVLEWNLEVNFEGFGSEPWDLRESIDISEIVNDNQICGVVYCVGNFYIAGGNEQDVPMIYEISPEGELLNSFQQAGNPRLKMRDLAYDGELICGTGERNVYGFNSQGEVVNQFSGPFYPNTAIACDPERNGFWICGTITPYIALFNVEGEELAQVDRFNLNIFGLAFWEDDPDGYPLYVLHSPDAQSQVVSKINPETNEIMDVITLDTGEAFTPEGCFITTEYDPLSTVFMNVSTTAEADRLDIWQLSANSSWLDVDIEEGVLNGGAEETVTISFNAESLIPNDYEGELHFTHNAFDAEMTVPITMTVLDPRRVGEQDSSIPDRINLHPVYPNPFNSTAAITFALPSKQRIDLRIYDLNGQLIETAAAGEYQAGIHRFQWNGDNLTSGVYFVELSAGRIAQREKVILVK